MALTQMHHNIHQPPNQQHNHQQNCYHALLSLAEEFRTHQPPDIRSCIQCLMAVLNLPPPLNPLIEIKTNLQLGRLIMQETSNVDIAQNHLDKAVDKF